MTGFTDYLVVTALVDDWFPLKTWFPLSWSMTGFTEDLVSTVLVDNWFH